MKNTSIALIAITFLAMALSTINCTKDAQSENNSLDKLQKVTYEVICNVLLKTTNKQGQAIYINAKGEASYYANTAKHPFVLSGTGCLLGQSHFGTVAHVSPKNFDEEEFKELIKKAELEQDTIFFKNLVQSIDLKQLILPADGGRWEYYRVNSFIIPQGTSVEQLRRTLEEFPFQIPDGCIEIQNPKESMNYDLAIYELKEKLLDDVEGFSIEDIATDADIKAFKQQRSEIYDVVSWGYPMGIFTTVSDNVTPQPCKGQVTVWPNSTFPFVQTNLRINQGASGSFVLTMQGKVIGLVVGTDSTNTNNTLCVPANFLRDMYQEILEHSN